MNAMNCEVCGVDIRDKPHCTNRLCIPCHGVHCTDGGATYPGHNRKKMSRYFQPMMGDPERCAVCHAPQMDHYNGACREECAECAMEGSGQFMRPADHANDCSRAKVRT